MAATLGSGDGGNATAWMHTAVKSVKVALGKGKGNNRERKKLI